MISFLFSTFFSYQTSVSRATKQVEDHLQKSQRSFHRLLVDTAFLYSLSTENYSNSDPAPVFEKPFNFFLYSSNDIGNPILTFWNNHTVEPLYTDVNGNDGIQQALVKKLQQAKESAARGNTNAMRGQLNAFINQVKAQSGKALTEEHARELIELVDSIK